METIDIYGPFFANLTITGIPDFSIWLLNFLYERGVILAVFVICVALRLFKTVEENDWVQFLKMFVITAALTLLYKEVVGYVFTELHTLATTFSRSVGFGAIMDKQTELLNLLEEVRQRSADKIPALSLLNIRDQTLGRLSTLSSELIYNASFVVYMTLHTLVVLIRSLLVALLLAVGALFVSTIIIEGYKNSYAQAAMNAAFFILMWVVVEGIAVYVGGQFFLAPFDSVLAQLETLNNELSRLPAGEEVDAAIVVTRASIARVYLILSISVLFQSSILFITPFLTQFLLGRTGGISGMMHALGLSSLGAGVMTGRMGAQAGALGTRAARPIGRAVSGAITRGFSKLLKRK